MDNNLLDSLNSPANAGLIRGGDIFTEMGDVWHQRAVIQVGDIVSDLYYEPQYEDICIDANDNDIVPTNRDDSIYDIDSAVAKKICSWLKCGSLRKPLRATFCGASTDDLDLIPRYVRDLILTGNVIKMYDTFLGELRVLNLAMNPLKTIDILPSSLKELDVAHTLLERLPSLPEGLEKLNISNTRIKRFYRLPSNLKKLVMNECGVRRIENGVLPFGLRHLECALCELEKLPSTIPDTVVYLNVAMNNIRVIKRWPDALQYLDIRMNPFDGAVPAYVHEIVR